MGTTSDSIPLPGSWKRISFYTLKHQIGMAYERFIDSGTIGGAYLPTRVVTLLCNFLSRLPTDILLLGREWRRQLQGKSLLRLGMIKLSPCVGAGITTAAATVAATYNNSNKWSYKISRKQGSLQSARTAPTHLLGKVGLSIGSF